MITFKVNIDKLKYDRCNDQDYLFILYSYVDIWYYRLNLSIGSKTKYNTSNTNIEIYTTSQMSNHTI